MVSKVNGATQVKAAVPANKKKKVAKPKEEPVFKNQQKKETAKKVNDSAVKQEVYKKTGFQLKDTNDNGNMITLTVNGKPRQYKTVGTLTTGGRILVQDEKGAYHVVSHTQDHKLIMLNDEYARNKIAFETAKQNKVKYGKKEYVITNAHRDRHGRMTAIDANGRKVILSSKGQELKTGYVEAQDQVDRINDIQKDQNTKKTVFEKSGFQLKDTNNANEKLQVNGKEYTIVGTLTSGGRILVQDEKGAYHVISRTQDNKLTLLNDNWVKKNKNFATSDNYVEQLDKATQSVTDSHASYASKNVMRFKASNGEVWYYDLKTKKYLKYADTEAKAIVADLEKGATEDWLIGRTGLGTDYELLKKANDNIIDPEVLKRVNKHFEAEYGSKVDKNTKYGDNKYRTAYEAFLASEIGDDEVYLFNASLVKNGAILDQSRRNEILQTNLTKVGTRENRHAAADAASTKEDYQALQDAAEEENKKQGYKAQFKGQDALQTYVYGVNNGDVQEIDDFNTVLIDPIEDMIDRDDIVRIKAETGALWLKKVSKARSIVQANEYADKAFESHDREVINTMLQLQSSNGKQYVDAKKALAGTTRKGLLMAAKPELYTDKERAEEVIRLLERAKSQLDSSDYVTSGKLLVTSAEDQMTEYASSNHMKQSAEDCAILAWELIQNDNVLNMVKKSNSELYEYVTDRVKKSSGGNIDFSQMIMSDSKGNNAPTLSPEEKAQNKAYLDYIKGVVDSKEREHKIELSKGGCKNDFIDGMAQSYGTEVSRADLENYYQMVRANISKLELAAEGELLDASGKPVSFEKAVQDLMGKYGVGLLEEANQKYSQLQATGEFVVDMLTLATPYPIGSIVQVGRVLFKVVEVANKTSKVVKVTQAAVKGEKIINYSGKIVETTTKGKKTAKVSQTVSATQKLGKVVEASVTGAMHMGVKTAGLEVSNIATSREGFSSDRVAQAGTKIDGAVKFGAMGGAIGGTTAVVAGEVTSVAGQVAVHTTGLAADILGAAGLMTAESHGETTFMQNLVPINEDGSINYENLAMQAMMVFGHLHGMSAIKGKRPKLQQLPDGNYKATIGNRELSFNKETGRFHDSVTGKSYEIGAGKKGQPTITEYKTVERSSEARTKAAEESRAGFKDDIIKPEETSKEFDNNMNQLSDAVHSETGNTIGELMESNPVFGSMKESLVGLEDYTIIDISDQGATEYGSHSVSKQNGRIIGLNLKALSQNEGAFRNTLAHEAHHARQQKKYVKLTRKSKVERTDKEKQFISDYKAMENVNKRRAEFYQDHKAVIDKFAKGEKLTQAEEKIVKEYEKLYDEYNECVLEVEADKVGKAVQKRYEDSKNGQKDNGQDAGRVSQDNPTGHQDREVGSTPRNESPEGVKGTGKETAKVTSDQSANPVAKPVQPAAPQSGIEITSDKIVIDGKDQSLPKTLEEAKTFAKDNGLELKDYGSLGEQQYLTVKDAVGNEIELIFDKESGQFKPSLETRYNNGVKTEEIFRNADGSVDFSLEYHNINGKDVIINKNADGVPTRIDFEDVDINLYLDDAGNPESYIVYKNGKRVVKPGDQAFIEHPEMQQVWKEHVKPKQHVERPAETNTKVEVQPVETKTEVKAEKPATTPDSHPEPVSESDQPANPVRKSNVDSADYGTGKAVEVVDQNTIIIDGVTYTKDGNVFKNTENNTQVEYRDMGNGHYDLKIGNSTTISMDSNNSVLLRQDYESGSRSYVTDKDGNLTYYHDRIDHNIIKIKYEQNGKITIESPSGSQLKDGCIEINGKQYRLTEGKRPKLEEITTEPVVNTESDQPANPIAEPKPIEKEPAEKVTTDNSEPTYSQETQAEIDRLQREIDNITVSQYEGEVKKTLEDAEKTLNRLTSGKQKAKKRLLEKGGTKPEEKAAVEAYKKAKADVEAYNKREQLKAELKKVKETATQQKPSDNQAPVAETAEGEPANPTADSVQVEAKTVTVEELGEVEILENGQKVKIGEKEIEIQNGEFEHNDKKYTVDEKGEIKLKENPSEEAVRVNDDEVIKPENSEPLSEAEPTPTQGEPIVVGGEKPSLTSENIQAEIINKSMTADEITALKETYDNVTVSQNDDGSYTIRVDNGVPDTTIYTKYNESTGRYEQNGTEIYNFYQKISVTRDAEGNVTKVYDAKKHKTYSRDENGNIIVRERKYNLNLLDDKTYKWTTRPATEAEAKAFEAGELPESKSLFHRGVDAAKKTYQVVKGKIRPKKSAEPSENPAENPDGSTVIKNSDGSTITTKVDELTKTKTKTYADKDNNPTKIETYVDDKLSKVWLREGKSTIGDTTYSNITETYDTQTGKIKTREYTHDETPDGTPLKGKETFQDGKLVTNKYDYYSEDDSAIHNCKASYKNNKLKTEEYKYDNGDERVVTYDSNEKELVNEYKFSDNSSQITEAGKGYDLVVDYDNAGNPIKATKEYPEGKGPKENGNESKPVEYAYDSDKKQFVRKEGDAIVETLEYNKDKHTWEAKDKDGKTTYKDDNGAKISENKSSHKSTNSDIKRGLALAGALVFSLPTSDNDENANADAAKASKYKQAKTKQYPNPKVEDTEHMINGKPYTVADGKVTYDGTEYSLQDDGYYHIGDKKYELKDGKLQEVTDAAGDSDDNGKVDGDNGGGTQNTTTAQVTVGGKNLTVTTDANGNVTEVKDGETPISKNEDGTYTIDGKKYKYGNGAFTEVQAAEVTSEKKKEEKKVTSPETKTVDNVAYSVIDGKVKVGDNTISPVDGVFTINNRQYKLENDNLVPHNPQPQPRAKQEQPVQPKTVNISGLGDVTVQEKDGKPVVQYNGKEYPVTVNGDKATVNINDKEYTLTPKQKTKNEPKNDNGDKEENTEPENNEQTPAVQPAQAEGKKTITPSDRLEFTQRVATEHDVDKLKAMLTELATYKPFTGRRNLRKAIRAKIKLLESKASGQELSLNNVDQKAVDKFGKRMDRIHDSKSYQKTLNQVGKNEYTIDETLDELDQTRSNKTQTKDEKRNNIFNLFFKEKYNKDDFDFEEHNDDNDLYLT